MDDTRNNKSYRSPARKLIRFFEKSRDQWKSKHHKVKAGVKRLNNRVRFLEKSKEQWKERVKELEKEVAVLKAREQTLEQALNSVKKRIDEPVGLEDRKDWQLVPYRHRYSIGCISLFISLILSAAVSLRGTSRSMQVVFDAFQIAQACPSWFAGRLWLLRLGYYKLMRAKVQAQDWVWIVDHTVQLGDDKCLVILGARLSDLATSADCISHADLEPIDLVPVKKSNGEVVYQQLEQASVKTGVPRAILSDHGTDLNAGVEKFCQKHPGTSALYDIKHKTAALLKREFNQDPDWNRFIQLAAQTKRKVQQTALAALSPPNQKTKARYMNIDILVHWAQNMVTSLDTPDAARAPIFDGKSVEEKLGWLRSFRSQLKDWDELFEMLTAAESFIRHKGLYQGVHQELIAYLFPLSAQTERTQRLRHELVTFVAEQEAKVRSGERLFGSSEVIESVFGKLKRLEQDQSKNGFTGLLLGLGALVSTTTNAVIQTALETVSTKQVEIWHQETLGQTVQSKRRQVFAAAKKSEQKRDQLQIPV